ncbi:MAG: phosphatase PAP2 family protein [Actinomycetota bacterium]|nr:phosphatase PAP2 family protein [Actinomycetota bacterium]
METDAPAPAEVGAAEAANLLAGDIATGDVPAGDIQAGDMQAGAGEAPAAKARNARSGFVHELALVLGFYYLYQTIRSLADHVGASNRAHANAVRVVNWERSLNVLHEQAIQQAFLGARWFIKGVNIYYGTLHFLVTAGLLIWLYLKRHDGYRRMRDWLGASTALALIGYWAFPLAPPRLYACNRSIPVAGPDGYTIGKCFVDTLAKVGGLWSYESPVATAVANQYAAMPSLHFGWSVWCGVVMYQFAAHRSVRILGVLYPLVTLFAIVVTANHYFLDAVGGVLIVVLAKYLLIRRTRHRSTSDAPAGPAAAQ